MTRLPSGARAIVDMRKLEDYCFSPVHPRGRHKARVFREALGIGQNHASWLRRTILQAAATNDAVELAPDSYGSRWQMDVRIERHDKIGMIRTLWIVRTGENRPRFITCWML